MPPTFDQPSGCCPASTVSGRRRNLALASLVLSTLALGACGSTSTTTATPTDSGSSASATTAASPSTSAAPSPSADTSGVAPFTVTLPDGWSDNSAAATPTGGVNVYKLLRGPAFNGFTTNVNVTDSGGADQTIADFKTQFPQILEQLKSSRGATEASGITDLTVGGEPAASYSYIIPKATTQPVKLEQVVVAHNHKAYITTFTVAADHYTDQQPSFQQILDSWKWSS